VIALDGDEPGRDAARALAERAYGLGWQVSLMPAPNGCDWNDVLGGKAVAACHQFHSWREALPGLP